MSAPVWGSALVWVSGPVWEFGLVWVSGSVWVLLWGLLSAPA